MTDSESDTERPQIDESIFDDDRTKEIQLANSSDVLDSRQLVAQCPHCDHSERFDDKATARAWMTAHILDDHSDELPDTEVQR